MSEKLTVHAKMALIKKELSAIKIPKSGFNRHTNVSYHELSDFLNLISVLNEKHGVNEFCEISEKEQECRITIVNTEDSSDYYTIRTPYKNAQMLGKGGSPSNVDEIQRAGATVTYNRRYLYVTAYSINENCIVDAKEPVTPELPDFTEENFEKAKSNNATIQRIKKYYTVSAEIEKKYLEYLQA
jgi:hypothetical protein